jgi:hypothetical protein
MKNTLTGVFQTVSTTGVEPARANAHYPLKVARLPIPPRRHMFLNSRLRHYARYSGGIQGIKKPMAVPWVF